MKNLWNRLLCIIKGHKIKYNWKYIRTDNLVMSLRKFSKIDAYIDGFPVTKICYEKAWSKCLRCNCQFNSKGKKLGREL